MGYLERNSETWKTPGFWVLNVGFQVLVGFQFSGLCSKKVGVLPWIFGFQYLSLDKYHFLPQVSLRLSNTNKCIQIF